MLFTSLRRLGIAAALAAPTLLASPAPVSAADGDVIVGTVVDSDGVGVPGITVWICRVAGSSCTTPTTDAAGTYSVSDYTDGSYNFWLSDSSERYIRQIWPAGTSSNDAFPTSVDFSTGGDQTISHTVLRRPTISGQVTDNFGNPLQGIDVRFTGPGLIDPVTTDAEGRYSTRLDEGDYTVAFNQINRVADHPVEYWNGTEDFAERDTIAAIADGEITGIDASLYTFGRIEGVVTDETGAPISGVTVRANTDDFSNNSSATTGADGSYSMLVRADDFRVTFSSPNHLDEGWDDVGRFDPDAQTVITVTEAQVVEGVDAQLAGTGVVTGTVTDEDGAPIVDAEVSFAAIGFSAGRIVQTGADGSYAASDLTPGEYEVRFSADGHFTEYHDDERDAAAATAFVVTNATSTLDASLARSGRVVGQLTDHLGAPISASVSIRRESTDETRTINTELDGSYSFSDLEPGDYQLTFFNGGPQYPLAPHRDADFELLPVAAVTGETVVVDHRFQLAGSIGGTVTAVGVGPIVDVVVFACGRDERCESGQTATDGTYSIEGLLPGPFTVSFQPPTGSSYPIEYFDDVLSVDDATDVMVGEDAVTAGIDADLDAGGSISGVVRHPDGRGVFASEILIEACSASLGFCSGTTTTGALFGLAQGEYRIDDLPPATDYVVKFDGSPFADPGEERLADEWFRNASSAAAATPVTVVAGVDTTGIDASLDAVDGPDPDPDPDTRAPFFSIEPTRLADTRAGEKTIDGQYEGDGIVNARGTYVIQITGRPGIPVGATAAVLNLTVTAAQGPGFATVFPCGSRPLAAGLTYGPGDTRSNETITKLSATGTVCVYSEAAAHYVIDAVGFVSNSPYGPIEPTRLADTRAGEKTIDGAFEGEGIVDAMDTYEIQIGGRPGVPAAATAVVVNITATGTEAPGFAVVHPCASKAPLAAGLTYGVGDTRSNELIAKLSATGAICITSAARAHYVVDAVGFIESSGYSPLTPERFADTRPGERTVDGDFAGDGRVGAGGEYEVQVAGRSSIPLGARSVVLNLSVTETASPGFVTLSTCGQLPLAAALTYGPNDTRSNEVVVQLTGSGSICATSSAATHLVIDVVGWS